MSATVIVPVACFITWQLGSRPLVSLVCPSKPCFFSLLVDCLVATVHVSQQTRLIISMSNDHHFQVSTSMAEKGNYDAVCWLCGACNSLSTASTARPVPILSTPPARFGLARYLCSLPTRSRYISSASNHDKHFSSDVTRPPMRLTRLVRLVRFFGLRNDLRPRLPSSS